VSLDRRSRQVLLAVALVAAAWVAMVAFPAVVPTGKVAKGIAQGSVTGLLAVGLVLVYRTTRVVNFAYGAMGGLGGSVGVLLFVTFDVPWPLCIVVATVLGVAIGLGTERIVIRRFERSSRLVLTVATIGLAQLLGGAAILVPTLFGQSATDSISSFSTPFSTLRIQLTAGQIDGNDLAILAVVPAVLFGLGWFLTRTDVGMATRAMAENQDRAQLLGVPVRKLASLVWGVIGGLAALTVILQSPGQGVPLDAAAGPTILLPALAAAIVGRMTSLPGAFAAGVGLGLVDQVVSWNFPSKSATTYVVFLVVILGALLFQRGARSRAEAADEASWTLGSTAAAVPFELRDHAIVRWLRYGPIGAVAAATLLFGITAGPSNLNRVSTAVVFGIVAVSLVVLTGWTGTVSLGQFAIVGVSGLVAANLIARWNVDYLVVLTVAAAVGAFVAVLIGIPALRVQGLFLAVTTLAFAVAMNFFFLSPVNFPDWIPSSYHRPVLFKHIDLFEERSMYFLVVAVLVGVTAIARALRSARTGRVLIATRDNPRAVAAMSVPALRTKLVGFAISGAIAGVAGGLHATLLRSVGFGTYPPSLSLLVFSMAVIGGVGSLSGTLAGVALVQTISYFFPRVELIITGALVLIVLYLFPGGIGQLLTQCRDLLLRRYADARGIELRERFADGAVDTLDADTGAGTVVEPFDDDAPPIRRTHVGETAEMPKLLSARSVTASYGSLQVLFGVDLEVEEGELVALLGTNGAGKSTVLKAICGLMPEVGGEVDFAGTSLNGLATDRVAAAGLTIMPGGKGIFPTLTVAENLRVAGWLSRRDSAAAQAALADALDLFPRLQERIGVPAGNLSGGEQQQLSLAMAFLTRPKLLCIDELSLGLAPAIVAQLIEKVRAIHASGTTVVIVEQSVSTALELAERGIFLEKGQVRFSGATKDLLDRPDILRAVFIGAGGDDEASAATNGHDPSTAASGGERREPSPAGSALSLRGVRKSFGGITVIPDLDLDVAPGEVVGLIGHNGAGKTTLFDIMSGFLGADHGTIALDADDITTWAPHTRALAGIGRSFQEARLFPSLTVLETVLVALDAHLANRDPVAAALALPASLDSEAAAVERADQLLTRLGLQGYRDKPIGELSTGTRRIVEIACVLAQEPTVVLLDEPSAGVAQAETEALGPLLRQVHAETGCTMLLIEHDMGLMRTVCDRLVALEQGQIIADGPTAEVLTHPAVVASYLGSQPQASPPPTSARRRVPLSAERVTT
jgi:ABC-type branched-subunit amino acid transport system ATPase component/branched-subunit amino acid ABC-type transport system permease component